MRVLVVSPCPTHPPIEGNCRRVLTLVGSLVRLGCEAHVLYLPMSTFPRADLKAMRQKWGKRLHVGEPADPPPRKHLYNCLLRKLNDWRWAGAEGRGFTDELETAYDGRYNPRWNHHVCTLHERYGFDAVIVEYIFLSRVLRVLPGVRKIVDTHDVFTDRDARMAAAGDRVRWLETTAADEATGLNRADVVIAIQEEEAEHFRGVTRSQVVTVGHLVEDVARPVPEPSGPPSVLMLGGPHSLNVQGLLWFLAEVWPRVCRAIPDVVFRVAGRLGESLPRGDKNVEVLGILPHVADAYGRAHLVINPSLAGTGLPIKTIEALAHGKPMVLTPAGARGLGDGSDRVFWVADAATSFADAVIELLRNQPRRRSMAFAAWEYGSRWNDRQLKVLGLALGLSSESAGMD
jgi:polysaccharide biosynthesis protein PslH